VKLTAQHAEVRAWHQGFVRGLKDMVGAEVETREQFFQRPDTPAADSPVGRTMVRVLEKNPGMGFEEARSEAKRLLSVSAKGRVYRQPRILSAEEKAEQKVRLATAFSATRRPVPVSA
jgi:hypothetical protein